MKLQWTSFRGTWLKAQSPTEVTTSHRAPITTATLNILAVSMTEVWETI